MDRKAEARWSGDLKTGQGHVALGSKSYEGPYSFSSRFEDGKGTNPEELLGAAHAGCFSMALSLALGEKGIVPTRITTTATVHLGKPGGALAITGIDLVTRGVVPGLSDADFKSLAEATKTGCIVSRALGAVPMSVDAKLEK